MEEFRGLYSVVQVWRDVREDIEDPGQFPPALADVLRMADEYMTEVESQSRDLAGTVEDGHSLTDGAYLPTRGTDSDRGLFAKYQVTRNDNTDLAGGKHYGCPLFVLDIRHDPHARRAAKRYAQSASRDMPQLAQDLLTMVYSEEPIKPTADLVDTGMAPAIGVEAPVFSPNLAEVPMLPEYHCGQTDPHHGHAWRMTDMPATEFDSNNPVSVQVPTSYREVWCVGSHG